MDDTDPGLTPPITVFLLDDHEIVRRGLIDLLSTTTDIIVVGEAGTAADGLARACLATLVSPSRLTASISPITVP